MKKLREFSLATDDAPIIRAMGVTKEYDTGKLKVLALKGIDLTIERGEVVAIMGPSGCGKTTLLNCLSGLDAVTSGSVIIAGHDVTALSDRELTAFRACQMGFVFQTYNLLPVLTALENVELPLLVSGVRAKEARERALVGLEQVGLLDWVSPPSCRAFGWAAAAGRDCACSGDTTSPGLDR